jgi:hypothetical protein
MAPDSEWRRSMPVGPVESFTIDNESEADDYLDDLLKRPENRSMDIVERHASNRIKDTRIRHYFVTKATGMLAE